MNKNNELPKAMNVLKEALKDQSYRDGWRANIAMSMKDALTDKDKVDHETLNRGADKFIDLLINQ